uniref:CRAL-TRIO domain-containing protein n=1 Tax=Caenorhabditis japonica TaxID=281687 RepID=A0A8R1HQ91_CAEJA
MSISETDRKAIDELREAVKEHLTPYYDTDFNLLRWLKGHDYKLDVIKPKLINHLLFRKSDWDLDTLAEKPRDHPVHHHWKTGLTGESGIIPNTIVNIEQTGSNDYWGMLNSYPTNEILRARVHDLESMLKAVMDLETKTNEQCSVVYIMDLTGIKMDKRTMTLLTGGLSAISAFMAEHYVELVHSFVLVNVPGFISAIWTIAKPLLPERTRNKCNIMGNNWKVEILKLADGHCLPAYWNDDGDDVPFTAPIEKCVPFPEENYYKGKVPEKADHLAISAGKTGFVDIEVKTDQTLSWEIHANGHFSFAIYELPLVPNNSDDVNNYTRLYPLFSGSKG